EGGRCSWCGLPRGCVANELGGLPVDRAYKALRSDGCHEVDRPGSTCPINLLPLFQEPAPLFALYNGKIEYTSDDFTHPEAIHHGTIKMPVWHHENDIPLVNSYIEAFRKVIDNYHDLLG